MQLTTDLDTVVGLIYDTDEYLFPFLFGRRSKALPVLAELVKKENNSFSHRHILCEVEGGRVRGILLGYDHRLIDAEKEEADFKAVLPLFDQVTLFLKSLILRQLMNKSDITGAYIQNVCVDPAFRGQGVGSALIRHFCKTQGGPIFLDVEFGNKQAMALYGRLGFRTLAKMTVLLPGLGNYRMVRQPEST